MIRKIVFAALWLWVGVALAQSPPNETASLFDVISIKEAKPSQPFSVGSFNPAHSGKFRATNYTAMILIQVAYGVTDLQVSGAPGWLRETRFEIQAQADESVDHRLEGLSDEDAALEKRRMLQGLLAERFKLRVHEVSKNLAAYALVVTKSGAKFSKSKEETKDGLERAKAHPIEEHPTSNGVEYWAHGASMELLAAHLTGLMGATVLDRTGLGGQYDFTLQSSGAGGRTDSAWPSIFSALTEQLGLRLQSIKGPVLDLVIDHIEKPSEN
jgi:uncharacterized protein (TIGR03435 family)